MFVSFVSAALTALVCPALPVPASDPGITLIGRGFVPGNALDHSGLQGTICSADNAANCIDQRTLGGFGSAFTYTGHDDVFLAAPDRGPFDGRTSVDYLNRFDFFRMRWNV